MQHLVLTNEEKTVVVVVKGCCQTLPFLVWSLLSSWSRYVPSPSPPCLWEAQVWSLLGTVFQPLLAASVPQTFSLKFTEKD